MLDEFDAEGPEDLKRSISQRVAKKPRDKTSREWWCLHRLSCEKLVPEQLIQFPVRVSKKEPPDFVLCFGKKEIGLEVVRATWQRDQQAQSLRAEKAPGTILPMGPLFWSDRVFGTGDGKDAWRKESPGYDDGEAEDAWIDLIKRRLQCKFRKRTSIACEECWLVVDATETPPELEIERVEEGLKETLTSGFAFFSIIWVDYGGNGEIRQHDRS